MKKVLALALAAVMVMALCGVAFADPEAPSTPTSPFDTSATVNVTVTGLMAGDTLHLYKLGTPVVDASNQMSISWNPTAVGTLVEGAATEGWSYSPTATLQAGIAALIGTGEGKINVSGDGNFSDTVDAGETSATAAVAPGYYLALVKQGAASDAANIIYQNMLINAIPEPDAATGTWAKHADVTATVKYTEEQIDKKQKEAGSDDWTDATVDGYKRGDFIPFKVETVIPSYPTNSLYATFVITDTANGLKFVNNDTYPLTMTVAGNDVTDEATNAINTEGETETFTISVADGAINVAFDKDYILAHPGQAVVLTYWAQLTATVETSNNEATITYNRNPDEATTQDDEDDVDQNTLGFTLLKYASGDSTKAGLRGAKFSLWTASDGGTKIDVIYATNIKIKDADNVESTVSGYRPILAGETPADYIEVDANGKANVYCLGDQTYYLQEDVAPAGYAPLATRQAITVNTTTTLEGVDVEIPNTPGATLPTTGGIGTTIFYVSGLIMVLGAATILISRRRAESK